MSVGLRASTIETFRRRNHGSDVLRLLELNADGQSLTVIKILTKGFFISPNDNPQEGAGRFILTVDLIYTPDLTRDNFLKTFMCDLRNPTTGAFSRYQRIEDTPPVNEEWRYLVELHTAFTDAKPIV